MTITIEVPEKLAQLAANADLTAKDLTHAALAGMAAVVEAANAAHAGQMPSPDASQTEVFKALNESAAQLRAGQLLTLEQVDAEFEAAIAASRRK